VVVEAAELLHYRQDAYRDAVVVIVSRSGKSVEIEKLISLIKGKYPIIGVSNEPSGPLAQHADISIHIGSLPDEMVAIQTYTGTVLTLYMLSQALIGGLEQTRSDLQVAIGQVARVISASFDEMQRWDGFLQVGSPVYLLARGPSVASAFEGALLFHEIAKSPAVAMPTGSFRHGPVEVVDEAFRSIIFAPVGLTRDLNISIAKDLARFGGKVRLVGPPDGIPSELEWCQTPELPEMLAPLVEVVAVQIAALRMAELRGIPAGKFRYTSQVAVDEARFSTN
jgi:glucosamine--fructose-6-phosphate aminotransferase (isomerizing)